MKGIPELQSSRLRLRPMRSSDEEQVFLLRSNPEVNRYIDRDPATSIENARDFIRMINEKVSREDVLYWAVTDKEGEVLLGTIGVFNFSEDGKAAEIGYELLPSSQGKGLMREALNVVIGYLFGERALLELRAFTHMDNRASIALISRLGFRREGEADGAFICYSLKNQAA